MYFYGFFDFLYGQLDILYSQLEFLCGQLDFFYGQLDFLCGQLYTFHMVNSTFCMVNLIEFLYSQLFYGHLYSTGNALRALKLNQTKMAANKLRACTAHLVRMCHCHTGTRGHWKPSK